MANINKFIKFENLPLDVLIVGKANVRTENIEESLADLMEHIHINGLLESIVVFSVDELNPGHNLYDSRKAHNGKYEILAGQRRYNAFVELNKKYPGEGFDKIQCHIRTPPEDEEEAKAISIGENLTQLPMTLADSIDACDFLFKKYSDERIIAKKFGISVQLTKKYVKFARLPKVLQNNLDSYHSKPKVAMQIALDATDALNYVKDGDIPVEKVHEFAQMLGKKKTKSNEDYKKLKKAGHNNPKAPNNDIEKESQKLKNPKKFTIILDPEHSDLLEESAEKHGVEPVDEAHDIVVEGLKTRFSKTEEMA